ncbi:unnamed protein product [Hymenolepis diminuta]|uniref:Uncharacterized protein n=1 Tax=Hymenolepis diminuta TaxID=6216 RepID=A0A564Y2R6_HYMDI|nr:unnamed protein product [Hymenolepis diminuta]
MFDQNAPQDAIPQADALINIPDEIEPVNVKQRFPDIFNNLNLFENRLEIPGIALHLSRDEQRFIEQLPLIADMLSKAHGQEIEHLLGVLPSTFEILRRIFWRQPGRGQIRKLFHLFSMRNIRLIHHMISRGLQFSSAEKVFTCFVAALLLYFISDYLSKLLFWRCIKIVNALRTMFGDIPFMRIANYGASSIIASSQVAFTRNSALRRPLGRILAPGIIFPRIFRLWRLKCKVPILPILSYLLLFLA